MTPGDFFTQAELTGNKSIALFNGDDKLIGWTQPRQFKTKVAEIGNLLYNKPGQYVLQAKPNATSKTIVLNENISPGECKTTEPEPIKTEKEMIDLETWQRYAAAEAENQYLKKELENLKAENDELIDTIKSLEADLDILAENEKPQGIASIFTNPQIVDSTSQLLQALALKLINNTTVTNANDTTNNPGFTETVPGPGK